MARLVTCSQSVRTWTYESTGKVVAQGEFSPHASGATVVRWNHNNLVIVSGGPDGLIALSHHSGSLLGSLRDSSDPEHAAIASLCFSSGSRYLCTGGADRVVKVWDLKNKSLIRRFTAHRAKVSAVIITADDSTVASGCDGGDVFLHSLHSSHQEASLSLHRDADLPAEDGVTCLSFSPVRPGFLAVATRMGSVLVWNTASREIHALYRRSHSAPVRGLCWSPVNQLLLASGAEDKRVLFYDVDEGRMVKSLSAPDPVSSMDFHYDGATLAAGTTTGRLFVFDLRASGGPRATALAHSGGAVHCVRFQNPPKGSEPQSAPAAKPQPHKQAQAQAPPSHAQPRAKTETVPTTAGRERARHSGVERRADPAPPQSGVGAPSSSRADIQPSTGPRPGKASRVPHASPGADLLSPSATGAAAASSAVTPGFGTPLGGVEGKGALARSARVAGTPGFDDPATGGDAAAPTPYQQSAQRNSSPGRSGSSLADTPDVPRSRASGRHPGATRALAVGDTPPVQNRPDTAPASPQHRGVAPPGEEEGVSAPSPLRSYGAGGGAGGTSTARPRTEHPSAWPASDATASGTAAAARDTRPQTAPTSQPDPAVRRPPRTPSRGGGGKGAAGAAIGRRSTDIASRGAVSAVRAMSQALHSTSRGAQKERHAGGAADTGGESGGADAAHRDHHWGGQFGGGVQHSMLRTVVQEVSEDLRQSLAQEVHNLHLEMLRQFSVQQEEISRELRRHQEHMNNLFRENRALQQEVEFLRTMH